MYNHTPENRQPSVICVTDSVIVDANIAHQLWSIINKMGAVLVLLSSWIHIDQNRLLNKV